MRQISLMRKFLPYLLAALLLVCSNCAAFAVWAIADGIHPPPWAGTALPVVGVANAVLCPAALVYFVRVLFKKESRSE